jgi:elongation factor G
LTLLVREVGRTGATTLLEPWMLCRIHVPEDHLSPVLGDVQAHGGEVLDVQVQSSLAKVKVRAPLSRMLDFTTRLRSLTQGRGASSMTLDRFREVSRADHIRLTGN